MGRLSPGDRTCEILISAVTLEPDREVEVKGRCECIKTIKGASTDTHPAQNSEDEYMSERQSQMS